MTSEQREKKLRRIARIYGLAVRKSRQNPEKFWLVDPQRSSPEWPMGTHPAYKFAPDGGTLDDVEEYLGLLTEQDD